MLACLAVLVVWAFLSVVAAAVWALFYGGVKAQEEAHRP
jgi:hypothetical protein